MGRHSLESDFHFCRYRPVRYENQDASPGTGGMAVGEPKNPDALQLVDDPPEPPSRLMGRYGDAMPVAPREKGRCKSAVGSK
ncbi:hypothetical protein KCU93_g270, partial [Aureobasidium melanogenum]